MIIFDLKLRHFQMSLLFYYLLNRLFQNLSTNCKILIVFLLVFTRIILLEVRHYSFCFKLLLFKNKCKVVGEWITRTQFWITVIFLK